MNLIKASFILLLLVCFQMSFSQNDCVNAILSCGNTNFNDLEVQGIGIQEITNLNTCGSEETNSLWIKATIKTDGTLGFIITPENNNLNIDFDFFVFGPVSDCQNLGNAIRCSTTNPIASGSTSNLTGLDENETDESEGPGAAGNNFVHWLDVVAGETYYIVVDRAVGDGNFSLDWTGTATFSDPPLINDVLTGALNIETCDTDSLPDDSTEVDLTQNQTTAIGTQNNIVATYYLTENDATISVNTISNPTNFSNTTNPQTVYIRLENSISGCFDIAPFTITITPFSIPDVNNLEECDGDNDGFAVFDLSEIRILLNADPNNTITFHRTNNDSINLPDNYTNQVAFTNEILWVKVQNTVNGCTAYKSFTIIINSSPTVTPSQLTQCDFELFPDGLTTFNLTQASASLTNGDNGLTVQFYLNSNDALNNLDEQNTQFNNTSNPQTLTVKVTNPSTSCFSLTTLILNVNVTPTTTVTLRNCDDSIEDGITTFNLAAAGFETTGTTVTYYNSINDALLEQNLIVTDQFSDQDIYVRVESGNDCIGIHIIRIEVAELPQVSIAIDGILCRNLPNRPVNLNTITDPLANYTFAWLPNGETTQNITVLLPGDYTVTATNTVSTCSKTVTINVGTSEIPLLNAIGVVDLVQVNSITVDVGGSGDFWFSLDDGLFQQSNFFDHALPGEHIITIEDRNGCGLVYQTVYVLGIPNYFTPNGDGFQDYWQIKGIEKNTNKTTRVYIFNRYGKLLKQISAQGEGWDGTYNGKLLPGDDYWYAIQFEDGRSTKGHFALKR